MGLGYLASLNLLCHCLYSVVHILACKPPRSQHINQLIEIFTTGDCTCLKLRLFYALSPSTEFGGGLPTSCFKQRAQHLVHLPKAASLCPPITIKPQVQCMGTPIYSLELFGCQVFVVCFDLKNTR